MENQNEIFVLRFFENNIKPESFSGKELGQLIISFYEGIKELIDVRYPQINIEDVKLSLVSVKDESESLVWKSSGQEEVTNALNDFATAISTNTYTDLPSTTYKTVKLIYGITKRKKCNAELVQKGKRLFVVTPADKLIEQQDVLIKSDLVLYGILNKIGGDKNRAWVELYDGSRISFPITDEQLVQLRGKTKEPIAISGKARWSALTKKVVQFKISSVIDYTAGQVAEGFDALRNISKGWDSPETNSSQGIINFLNGEA